MTIGIFDSGIGGLGIFDEIKKLMPNEQILYLADTANCPYGDKTEQQIKQICLDNSRFLIEKGADVIVIACNTGSTVALNYTRHTLSHPGGGIRYKGCKNIQIIGVVPVVKTCSEVSKNKQIGILATKRTVESQYLRDLVEKFCPPTLKLRGINPSNQGFRVYYQAANSLVKIVELGIMNYELGKNLKSTTKNLKLLEKYLQLFKDKDVDTIALGCTHFPFLRQQIEQMMGDKVKILDSNGAVARQTARIMPRPPKLSLGDVGGNNELGITNNKYNKNHDSLFLIPNSKKYSFYTTGDPEKLRIQIKNLINLEINKVDKVALE